MWFFDAHSREILQAVNDAGERSGRIQRLKFAWPFEQSVRYELAHGSFHFVAIVRPLDPVDQNDFNPTADYYIHLGSRLEKLDYEIQPPEGIGRGARSRRVLRRRVHMPVQAQVRSAHRRDDSLARISHGPGTLSLQAELALSRPVNPGSGIQSARCCCSSTPESRTYGGIRRTCPMVVAPTSIDRPRS